MAAIEQNITIPAGITSTAGTTFVSHEYTAHDDHSTANGVLRWSAPYGMMDAGRRIVRRPASRW